MKRLIKWLFIIGGIFVFLFIGALFIIPRFVNIQKYKPQLEKKVSEAIGRPCTLGGNLNLSLFPWIGVSLSDLYIGNPQGFKERDFIRIKSLEVRVKFLPLLSRDIQVKRFIIVEPHIVLERRLDGRGNWEGIGGTLPRSKVAGRENISKHKEIKEFPIKNLNVGEFAIIKGSLIYVDDIKHNRKEVSDVTLKIKDISLNHPINFSFSALTDGQPFSIVGCLGPLAKETLRGKGKIPMDLKVRVCKEISMNLKGTVKDIALNPQFDFVLQALPFSLRSVVSASGNHLPMVTADPKAFEKVSFKFNVKLNPQGILVNDGILDLDKSKLNFSGKLKNFAKPYFSFIMRLDKIDLDRYLPPLTEKKAVSKKITKPATKTVKKVNYETLRKLAILGSIEVTEIKVRGAKIQDLSFKITGKNGLFHINPLSCNLYKGSVSSKGIIDIRKDTPVSSLDLVAKGIQVNPLLNDVSKKDFLSGVARARLSLFMRGDNAGIIKRTLCGKGDILFKDGVIKGIDFLEMAKSARVVLGFSKESIKKSETGFSNLQLPFTITNGLMDITGTRMISPLFRATASGSANLVNETLDIKLEPKFVATLKGQGDKMERKGLGVPILITGTFSSPEFRPDLGKILKRTLREQLKNPAQLETIKKKAGSLLRMLPFGK